MNIRKLCSSNNSQPALKGYALDRLCFSTCRHFIDNESPSDAYGKRSVTCAGLLKELDRIAGMLTLDPRNLAHIFMALLFSVTVDWASDNRWRLCEAVSMIVNQLHTLFFHSSYYIHYMMLTSVFQNHWHSLFLHVSDKWWQKQITWEGGGTAVGALPSTVE